MCSFQVAGSGSPFPRTAPDWTSIRAQATNPASSHVFRDVLTGLGDTQRDDLVTIASIAVGVAST
jgi:hypothetical protein